mmetsp:Transcript_84234/g.132659  ORF Transcript_84234/g.132659 Transcript_84234/m.132659 type:complete len:128 (-) Transcript_84234:5-388(-)
MAVAKCLVAAVALSIPCMAQPGYYAPPTTTPYVAPTFTPLPVYTTTPWAVYTTTPYARLYADEANRKPEAIANSVATWVLPLGGVVCAVACVAIIVRKLRGSREVAMSSDVAMGEDFASSEAEEFLA